MKKFINWFKKAIKRWKYKRAIKRCVKKGPLLIAVYNFYVSEMFTFYCDYRERTGKTIIPDTKEMSKILEKLNRPVTKIGRY